MHRAATTVVILLLSAAGATTAEHPALKALAGSLRKSPWIEAIGEDYVAMSISAAVRAREDLTRSIVEPGARACA